MHDDRELVQQTLAGDAGSFSELVRRYQAAVQGLAYHILGNFTDAQDVVQEVFITAYLKLYQLKQPERFASWVRQITRNCCRMWWRIQREQVPIEDVPESVEHTRQILTPAEEVERKEMREIVLRALNQLSEKNRLVFTLYHLDGLTYQDIAHFLDVPVTTVEGRMHRARQQLKGRLNHMIEDTLQHEKLSEEFAERVVQQALERAREARQHWSREQFITASDEALQAAGDLSDSSAQAKTRIEVLSMLGDAESSWLGDPNQAMEHYESALSLARQVGDTTQEAELLKAMVVSHCRHGEYESLNQRADEAASAFENSGDVSNRTLMRAAQDLAEMLPGTWKPGEQGGYVMAAFPLESTGTGIAFLEPNAVRHYTWGCPSRCTALAHLLAPQRILGADLSVGASWEDPIQPHGRFALGWSRPEHGELIARSVVESDDDSVATPAGTFEGCLRVKMVIAPPDQKIAGDFVDRSYASRRLVWFAPGLGLVKMRDTDQNGGTYLLYLTRYEGQDGASPFPLEEGRVWRYQWICSTDYKMAMYEDLCRVVTAENDAVYLSSATVGIESPKSDRAAFFETALELERRSGDLEGQAAALAALVQSLEEDAPKRHALESLLQLYETLGNEWKQQEVTWQLQTFGREETPEESLQRNRERLELAHRLGDLLQEGRALLSLADCYQAAGEPDRSIDSFRQAAAVFRKLGDDAFAARAISQEERVKEMQRRPATDRCGYSAGEGILLERDGRLSAGSSSRGCYGSFPLSEKPGSPMKDFLWNGGFGKLELLGQEVGDTSSTGGNIGTPWGTEHVQGGSRLVSKSERVSVPAGEFADCILIETTLSASNEASEEGSERNRYRDYWSGTRQHWYAPGVGVVRVLYQHRNGLVTDIQLIEYSLTKPSEDYLPLALDNRWRYRWLDEDSGAVFEDLLRVATHRGNEWQIAFVTHAEVTDSV